MLAPGDRVAGVLEEPALVGEPVQVIEHRLVSVAHGSYAAGRHAATLAVISQAGQFAVLVRDDRPQQVRSCRGGGGGYPRHHVPARDHRAERRRDRGRIAVRHEKARSAREHLSGVRELRRHHRLAGRQCLDEHPRGDLLGRVVGQQHHVGRTDQGGQRAGVPVVTVEGDAGAHAGLPNLFAEAVTVGVALVEQHLRVRLAGHHVAGHGHQVAKHRHGLDAPLDALAGAEQAPRQDGELPRAERRLRHRGLHGGRAVRDDADLRHVDGIPGREPLARSHRHRDDGIGLRQH